MPKNLNDFWPQSVAHLGKPYLSDEDKEVVVAEISSEKVGPYQGFTLRHVALVPLAVLDDLLRCSDQAGTKVESWGPLPDVEEGVEYKSGFWVRGRTEEERFETVVNAWERHNILVLSPDDGFLMCYGLAPRFLNGGVVAWDDPSKPVYDVVRVQALSRYTVPRQFGQAYVQIRRDYLEDYLSLKGCAAVSVFYEERYSSEDPEFDGVLGAESALSLKLPGRQIDLVRTRTPENEEPNQMTRVWGRRLILKPAGRPITNEPELVLSWPDMAEPLTRRDVRIMRSMHYAYIRDEALQEFEDQENVVIHPDSGDIGFGGWWGTTRSWRCGRNYIAVDLRKLHESTPTYVIRHLHAFASTQEVAERQREQFGHSHVGARANALIESYFRLCSALARLSQAADCFHDAAEIGGLDEAEVRDRGWWRISGLRELGFVVPLDASRQTFFNRCGLVFGLVERLKPAPLRRILETFGVNRAQIKEIGSIKLIASISQLCLTASEHALNVVGDSTSIVTRWDSARILPDLEPLFSLNALRVCSAHPAAPLDPKSLNSFTIDPESTRLGWGLAVDSVYDSTSEALNWVAQTVVASIDEE